MTDGHSVAETGCLGSGYRVEFTGPDGSCASVSVWRCIYCFGRCQLCSSGFGLSSRGSFVVIDRIAKGCLPDGVGGAQTNPLGDGTVLTLSFSKLLLGAETLLALKNDVLAIFFDDGNNCGDTHRHLEGVAMTSWVDGTGEVVDLSWLMVSLCAAGLGLLGWVR